MSFVIANKTDFPKPFGPLHSHQRHLQLPTQKIGTKRKKSKNIYVGFLRIVIRIKNPISLFEIRPAILNIKRTGCAVKYNLPINQVEIDLAFMNRHSPFKLLSKLWVATFCTTEVRRVTLPTKIKIYLPATSRYSKVKISVEWRFQTVDEMKENAQKQTMANPKEDFADHFEKCKRCLDVVCEVQIGLSWNELRHYYLRHGIFH